MSSTASWILSGIQLGVSVTVIAAFIIQWLQWKHMGVELEESRTAAQTQNFFELINFLGQPEMREARRRLLELGLKDGETMPWNSHDRATAGYALYGLGVAGAVVREGGVNEALFLRAWAGTINRCSAASASIRRETTERYGNDYWENFDWIANRALVYARNSPIIHEGATVNAW